MKTLIIFTVLILLGFNYKAYWKGRLDGFRNYKKPYSLKHFNLKNFGV